MIWQLFLVGYLVLGAAAYIIRRHLARVFIQHSRFINGFFFIAVLYPLGLVVAAFTGPNLSIGWINVLLLLGGSAVFPIINLLAYRASKDVDAGLYTILQNLVPIVTIIAASVLLNEKLAGNQLLGAAIIIASAFLATIPRLRHYSKSSSAGLMIALAAVVLLGLAIVYERWMLTRMDFGAYLVFGWGAQTLWMSIIAWPSRKQYKILQDRKSLTQIMGFSVANAFKGVCLVAALSLSGNASMVGAFTGLMAAIVVLAAYFLLQEKEWLWLKALAATVGAAGLVILNST